MEKKKVAVIGNGNLAKNAIQAVQAEKDMHFVGMVVRREITEELRLEYPNITITNDIKTLGKVDVALLCVSSRAVKENAIKYLEMGINTIDSYDMHSTIYELRTDLEAIARKNNVVSIVSAGWDPGSDSVVRALLELCAPKGITYTNFGPGMSMGHTVAVKAIDSVENALSITIPLGTGIHRRMVYVQLKENADFKKVEKEIKNDPYFVHDETHVTQVKDVNALIDKGHGVNLVRKAVSGTTDNQLFEFNMKINNPALTTQIMVSCARAAMKQKPGAYTMIEIPMIDYLYGTKEELIRRLV